MTEELKTKAFSCSILNKEQRDLGQKLREALKYLKGKTGMGVTHLFWNEVVTPFLVNNGFLDKEV